MAMIRESASGVINIWDSCGVSFLTADQGQIVAITITVQNVIVPYCCAEKGAKLRHIKQTERVFAEGKQFFRFQVVDLHPFHVALERIRLNHLGLGRQIGADDINGNSESAQSGAKFVYGSVRTPKGGSALV